VTGKLPEDDLAELTEQSSRDYVRKNEVSLNLVEVTDPLGAWK